MEELKAQLDLLYRACVAARKFLDEENPDLTDYAYERLIVLLDEAIGSVRPPEDNQSEKGEK